MTNFAYGAKDNAFLNVREAANTPWRGITTFLNQKPYLVIDKQGKDYVLEGTEGDVQKLAQLPTWNQSTDWNRLVAASRLEGSPFTKGSTLGNYSVGLLHFDGVDWSVRDAAKTEVLLPLDEMVEFLDDIRYDKEKFNELLTQSAVKKLGYEDYDMPSGEMTCPECGSNDIQPDEGFEDSIWQCHGCGKQGYAEEFDAPHDLSQAPTEAPSEYPATTRGMDWYPDHMGYAHVAGTFHVTLPPSGWHLRVTNDANKIGLEGTITYPDGTTCSMADGMCNFNQVMMAEDPDKIPAIIQTMEDEKFWSIYKKWGGPDEPDESNNHPSDDQEGPDEYEYAERNLRGGKVVVSEDTDQLYTGPKSDAVVCPNCGSHTYRAFNINTDQVATLKCLTCGNEWERKVFRNPESAIKQAEDDYTCDNCSRGLSATEAMKGRLNNGNTICSDCTKTLHKLHTSTTELPDTPLDYFLDSMPVTAAPTDTSQIGEPYAAPYGPTNPTTPSDPGAGSAEDLWGAEEPEEADYTVANCPMCTGPGTLLGELGGKTWFRCRNCGTDFSENSKSKSSAISDIEDDRERRIKEHLDSTGQKLKAGEWYQLTHQNAGVPDKVQILNLADDRIEAAIHPDESDPFPIVIEPTGQYSFAPFEATQKEALNLDSIDKFFLNSALTGFFGPKLVHDVHSRLVGGEPPGSVKEDLGGQAEGQGIDPQSKQMLYGLIDDVGAIAGAAKGAAVIAVMNPGPGYAPEDFAGMNPGGGQVQTGTCAKCGRSGMPMDQSGLHPGLCQYCALGLDAPQPFQTGQPQTGQQPNMPYQGSLEKMSPGKEHMKGVSPKRNRQYEHILESVKKEHPEWSLERQKEYAARTVNKQREEDGETKDSRWKLARKDFTMTEQKELINENPNGRARNIDKLNLEGTHYQLTALADDPDFLWS